MDEFITIKNQEIPLATTTEGSASDRLDSSVPLFGTATAADTEGEKYDTVVMNPPFGSWRTGVDMAFLTAACSVRLQTFAVCASLSLLLTHFLNKATTGAVYSLHKKSTRDYIKRKAAMLGFTGEVLAEMRYDLPKTMKHHKDSSRDIEVDFWRFAKKH